MLRRGQIKQNLLILAASIIWLGAGMNIFRIGWQAWMAESSWVVIRLLSAIIVFFLFFAMFRKICIKNVQRISTLKNPGNPFAFFDLKGWMVMAFMIGLGIAIRYFHLLPDIVIGPFYLGLATALCLTGIIYLKYALFGNTSGK